MHSKEKILVVDDDRLIRKMLQLILKDSGFDVIFAQDGISCMQMAQKENPQLIVLDIGLPGGDGLLTLERLRKLGKFTSTPIVILTGSDDPDVRNRSLESGADAFVSKTSQSDQILSTIENLV